MSRNYSQRIQSLAASALSLLLCGAVNAQTNAWSYGLTNDDWSNNLNWTSASPCAAVNPSPHDVLIGPAITGVPMQPDDTNVSYDDADCTINSLELGDDSNDIRTLTIENGTKLTVSNATQTQPKQLRLGADEELDLPVALR